MRPFQLARNISIATGGGWDAETLAWEAAVVGLGGTVSSGDKDKADELIEMIQGESYNADILVVYAHVGTNLKAHSVPLRNSIAAPNLTNYGFVDADCTNAGCDNSAGGDKKWDTGLTPQSINGGAFGMGIVLASATINTTNVEPMGCYDSTAGGNVRGVLDLRPTLRGFRMGANANSATQAVAGGNGHWYGERASSTLRKLYLDGGGLVSNTTSDAGFSGSNTRTIHTLSTQEHDGTRRRFQALSKLSYFCKPLGDTNQAAFDALLDAWFASIGR